jgi:hypothetical protein
VKALEAVVDWLIDLRHLRRRREAAAEMARLRAETPRQTYERLMREGIDG